MNGGWVCGSVVFPIRSRSGSPRSLPTSGGLGYRHSLPLRESWTFRLRDTRLSKHQPNVVFVSCFVEIVEFSHVFIAVFLFLKCVKTEVTRWLWKEIGNISSNHLKRGVNKSRFGYYSRIQWMLVHINPISIYFLKSNVFTLHRARLH